jgi:hypothetical protein
MTTISAQLVRSLFEYNAETGALTWKVSRGNRIKIGDAVRNIDSKGYLRVTIGQRQYRAHRIVWLYVNGKFPAGHLDHVNCDRTDNRLANLRECDAQQNVANRRLNKNNTTGFKGVSLVTGGSSYMAGITYNRRRIHLGCFPTAEEAHAAYVAAAAKLFGDYANSGQ